MGDGSINPARLAVLLSGSGRSLENLIEHIERGTLDANIAVVVGSRECLGVEKAKAAGIPALVFDGGIGGGGEAREGFRDGMHGPLCG